MSRDLDHFDHLLGLLDLERRAEEAAHRAAQLDLTLKQRVARGTAIDDLETLEQRWGIGARVYVTFERASKRPVGSRFDPGAVVEVWPSKSDSVAQPCRGVVSRRRTQEVTVAFDRPPPAAYLNGRLRAELCANDVTYQRARRAVQKIAAMDRPPGSKVRDVLLARSRAGAAPIEEMHRQRLQQQFVAAQLNPEQQRAALMAIEATSFFLVHGPPGTGKSTVLAEVAKALSTSGKRVLVTAASNAAVDHLLGQCLKRGMRAVRIGHPARVADATREHTLDTAVTREPQWQLAQELLDQAHDLFGYARKQRQQGRSHERYSQAREAKRDARALLDEARQLQRLASQAVLERAQVVGATCANIEGHTFDGLRIDAALVDEATQAIEPICLLPFTRAAKVILAGDHKQLPPTVISQEAARKGLATSLFERLLQDHGDEVKLMLREQYRMHEVIMALPSQTMYDGSLRAHPSVKHRTLAAHLPANVGLDAPVLLFLDTAGKGFEESQPPETESYQNVAEALLVIQRAKALISAGLPATQIAVIAPYSAQVAHIRDEALCHDLPVELEIDTVDAFQGREKEAVLVSLTRSNDAGELGFLNDLRRINVALTRARCHLFVVGDSGYGGPHCLDQNAVNFG